mgnify:CR=1 FL=1|tara:strand:- start:3563 stop:4873 length:1311 start_codon:yes stop_codon:yes gene_type:complete
MDDIANKFTKMTLNSNEEQHAILTIGRWQPPHGGHKLLIDDVQNRVNYLKMIKKKAQGFIYISPSTYNRNRDRKKNPLTQAQKWYYLNLMHPNNIFNYLITDLNLKNSIKMQLLNNIVNDNFEISKNINIEDKNEKMIIDRKIYNLKNNFKEWCKKTISIVKKYKSKSPSFSCLNFLNGRGYTHVNILVGSDRVEQFKESNKDHLNKFIIGEIIQSGDDRGAAGKGEEDILLNKLNKKTLDIFNFCLNKGCGLEDKEEEKDGVYSGSRIRKCIYDITDLDYFVKGVKIGNMDNLDCLSLLNDVRKSSNLSQISIEKYNSELNNQSYKILHLGVMKGDESSNRLLLSMKTAKVLGGRKKKKTRKLKGGHHLYKRLGISKYASKKQIKKAYQKIKKNKKITKKIKHAYKVLSNKKTRKKYNDMYKKIKRKNKTKNRKK